MPTDYSRLKELSALLNAKSDALNEAIKKIEAQLAALRLGVSAWVKMYSTGGNEPDDDRTTTSLGYSKSGGSWCLTIMESSDQYDDIPRSGWPSITPLHQAPRDLRVQALALIPKLIAELEKQAEGELKKVEKAHKLAEELARPSSSYENTQAGPGGLINSVKRV